MPIVDESDQSGNPVPNNPTLPYQRTRGQNPGRVILSHNSESTITGIFHCDIPGACGVTQNLYVGIYNSTTGKLVPYTVCIYLVIQFICKEVSGTPVKDSIYIYIYIYNSSA